MAVKVFIQRSLTKFICRGKRNLMRPAAAVTASTAPHTATQRLICSLLEYCPRGLARDSQWLCGCDFLVLKRVFVGEVNHGSFGKLRTELAQHKWRQLPLPRHPKEARIAGNRQQPLPHQQHRAITSNRRRQGRQRRQ